MKSFIQNNILAIIGVFIGALGGYLYWKFVGCNTGTCPITSSPLNSTLYGAVLGGLFLSIFKRKPKKKEEE
ncbi:DUF6132 family protein [Bacteroides propionicifaciens]|jgi:CDP-diglyceride synthetase|uniref:DUF6132 family protein n=1 Tax=Bacteroides propionicifaciens TaxID=392838 RepID=UPI0003646981|nr:DUF6132 family protein [Bacteroides propionicifaciens]